MGVWGRGAASPPSKTTRGLPRQIKLNQIRISIYRITVAQSEGTANLTVPQKGLAALIAAHKPIDSDVPLIGVVPEYAYHFSFDPQSIDTVKRAKYEFQNPQSEYDDSRRSMYSNSGLDYFQDVLPRTDLVCRATFRSPAYDGGEKRLRGMMFERVIDTEIFGRYMAGMIRKSNAPHRDERFKLVRIDSEKRGELWAVNPREKRPGVDPRGFFEQCWFLNDKWCVQGDINALESQIDALSERKLSANAEHFNEMLSARLAQVKRLVPAASSPYSIEHNSVNTFNSLADLLQYQYIENVKSNSKKEPRVVEAVEPDPFGIYIRPRCTEDVAVIVNLLVRKAIARELGDILVLQAHAESYWHGAAGCFPAWQPVEEAEDR